jgi:catechol 2,3-dioxygenase-like lactoylglutathione lyase family enzyme
MAFVFATVPRALWRRLVLPGTNNRPDQAFVVTPDGVRIEILEDKTQTVPVKNEHIHLFVPESDIPKAQAW